MPPSSEGFDRGTDSHPCPSLRDLVVASENRPYRSQSEAEANRFGVDGIIAQPFNPYPAVKPRVAPSSQPVRVAAYLVLTMGIIADNCRLISRSTRRSIWYHKAVFFAEMTCSNIGTYFMRNASSCWSTVVDLFI